MSCQFRLHQIGVRVCRSAYHILQRRHAGPGSLRCSIIFTSVVLAKLLHLYAHIHSIPPLQFALWGTTFFFQDAITILLARLLTEERRLTILQTIASVVAAMSSLFILFMSSVNFAFYAITGAEIHWRHLKSFPQDAAGRRTLLYGSTGCFLAFATILGIAWALASHVHAVTGHILDGIGSLVGCSCTTRRRWSCPESMQTLTYTNPKQNNHEASSPLGRHIHTEKAKAKPRLGLLKRLSILFPFFLAILLQAARPHNSAYIYLSWTLPLVPFTDISRDTWETVSNKGRHPLSNCNSLKPPPKFDWLPVDSIAGFEDWYRDHDGTRHQHYSPAADCLHISNLGNDLLEPIANSLRDDSTIMKHVILIKLESTRRDVFPLIKNSYMWRRIAEFHQNHLIPAETEEALSGLTKNAEYLTGYYGGFARKRQAMESRGGISASNAFTTSTYTLKSITGTLCGVTPLIADFNRAYNHHIYQPCIAHILEAFNQFTIRNETGDFTNWPWQSVWMQSVTSDYDNQGSLVDALGFNRSVTRETLVDPEAVHFPPTSKDINYYGLPDAELKPYLRDAIDDAEKNRKRLFITHLTGTTHHPWGLPKDYPYSPYLGDIGYGSGRKLNRYLNTIGYVDKWLGEILEVLEETGIANQTLLVLAGDHGTSLPNDGSNTPYDNPHVGNFHIPLLFSHSALPLVHIESPVTSTQVLPTILDLLISSSSMSIAASKAGSDLLSLYEGQSLLRPLTMLSDAGYPSWQFSVMNPGGSSLAVRSTTAPFRLVVPLVAEVEWRFSDLSSDPQELKPILRFSWLDLVSTLEQQQMQQAVEWVEEAARAAKWWASENHRRWGLEKSKT